jgi:hypothetical protein
VSRRGGELTDDEIQALPVLQPGLPDNLQAGQRVVVEGHGFTPGAEVQIWLYSDPVLLATGLVALDGTIHVEVTVPDGVVGNHRIVAYEPATGFGARQAVSVDVATLAMTGRTHGLLALIGLVSVLVGIAFVLSSRSVDRVVVRVRADRRHR